MNSLTGEELTQERRCISHSSEIWQKLELLTIPSEQHPRQAYSVLALFQASFVKSSLITSWKWKRTHSLRPHKRSSRTMILTQSAQKHKEDLQLYNTEYTSPFRKVGRWPMSKNTPTSISWLLCYKIFHQFSKLPKNIFVNLNLFKTECAKLSDEG